MGGLVGCGCVVVGQVCISVVGDLVGGLLARICAGLKTSARRCSQRCKRYPTFPN
jgi:hypothetical protein